MKYVLNHDIDFDNSLNLLLITVEFFRILTTALVNYL